MFVFRIRGCAVHAIRPNKNYVYSKFYNDIDQIEKYSYHNSYSCTVYELWYEYIVRLRLYVVLVGYACCLFICFVYLQYHEYVLYALPSQRLLYNFEIYAINVIPMFINQVFQLIIQA